MLQLQELDGCRRMLKHNLDTQQYANNLRSMTVQAELKMLWFSLSNDPKTFKGGHVDAYEAFVDDIHWSPQVPNFILRSKHDDPVKSENVITFIIEMEICLVGI
jgi:hypothetical protein